MKQHNDLSYEEFASLRRRNKAKEQKESNDISKEELDQEELRDNDKEIRIIGSQTILQKLGDMLQTQEVQLVVLILIAVDIFGAVLLIYAEAKQWDKSPLLSIVAYESDLCLLLFSLELFLLLLAYGGAFFAHFGYTLDLLLVSVILYYTINSPGRDAAWKLLNVFRMWRVVKMINIVISDADSKNVKLRVELDDISEKLDAAKQRAKKAEQSLKRENDRYKRLEKNFRSQTEELDTMREALQIAAQTVARVQGLEGLENLLPEEELEELEGVSAVKAEVDDEDQLTDSDTYGSSHYIMNPEGEISQKVVS